MFLFSTCEQAVRDVDFGTYHHTTPQESKQIREYAAKAFSKLLRPLYPPRAALRILDAGCGLGFLTHVAAECFPKAFATAWRRDFGMLAPASPSVYRLLP
jgi:2-polyprenyl-3-methyl-5-hydroxy-6-metoxy-1,4-benzoquinol methylase